MGSVFFSDNKTLTHDLWCWGGNFPLGYQWRKAIFILIFKFDGWQQKPFSWNWSSGSDSVNRNREEFSKVKWMTLLLWSCFCHYAAVSHENFRIPEEGKLPKRFFSLSKYKCYLWISSEKRPRCLSAKTIPQSGPSW